VKLSIVIPCYNESGTISKILEKIVQTCKYDYEIIVVDDFSEDGSRAILNQELLNKKIDHLILNTKNYGKGYSVRQGLKKNKK
jgi:glycosyltransferase involved in cell wall biosynthesis